MVRPRSNQLRSDARRTPTVSAVRRRAVCEKPAAKTPEEAGFTKRLLKVLVAGDQPKAEAVPLTIGARRGVGNGLAMMSA